MQTTKTIDMRRRNSNCTVTYHYRHCLPERVGTTCGQPVHISFYLNDVQEAFSRRDLKKLYELFNPQYHG